MARARQLLLMPFVALWFLLQEVSVLMDLMSLKIFEKLAR